MKKLIIASSLVIAGLTAAGTASAAYAGGGASGGYSGDNGATQQGIYIEASGGGNYLQRQLANDLEYDWGWNAGGAIGYQMGPWRAAFAFGYLRNDLNELKSNSGLTGHTSSLGASGCNQTWTFMLNGYYDIHMDNWPIIPYVGIGLGAINLDPEFDSSTVTSTLNPPFSTGSENETTFGYQGILGVAYPINNFRIFAEYRNLNSLCYKLIDRGGSTVEDYYHNNLINVGVSYLFSMA